MIKWLLSMHVRTEGTIENELEWVNSGGNETRQVGVLGIVWVVAEALGLKKR